MSRTLVYSCGGGRLGNQLLNYAHLLAFSLEHSEFDVLDLAFTPYVSEYGNEDLALVSIDDTDLSWAWRRFIETFWGDSPLEPTFSTYPVNRFRLQALHGGAHHRSTAQSIIGGDPHVSFDLSGTKQRQFDLSDRESVNTVAQKKTSVLAGWGVRAWTLIRKHRKAICERLRPGENHLSNASSYVAPLKDEYDLLVGVLIRQGDYRTHLDGKFFFESEQYHEILEGYARNRTESNVGFIIASDEEQPADLFNDSKYNFATGQAVGSNSYVESFAELMLCDVVMTPPSTFSIMSAFLNNTSLVPIHEHTQATGWDLLSNPLFDSLDYEYWIDDINY
jgi:hypothetical protein